MKRRMTKKFSTLLLLSLSYVAVTQAQIKKKSTLLGGQIFYYTSNIDYSWNQSNQKEKDGAFNILIGRALKDNAVLGVAASYQPSTLNNFFNGSTFVNEKVNQYSFGVFYRQYKTLAKDFYFFAQPEAD